MNYVSYCYNKKKCVDIDDWISPLFMSCFILFILYHISNIYINVNWRFVEILSVINLEYIRKIKFETEKSSMITLI